MDRNELAAYLDALLECGRFRDYCPNGLQVEGRAEVRRIVCGVSASQTLLAAETPPTMRRTSARPSTCRPFGQ